MADDATALNRIHQAMTAYLMQELTEREAFGEVVGALETTGRRLLDPASHPANDNQRARARN